MSINTFYDYEFFVYGCRKHVLDFISQLPENIFVLDKGELPRKDIHYGQDCAFEGVNEGYSDYYVLLGVNKRR